MKWTAVEKTLYDASLAALTRFAAEHLAERFYGFIFDVNADYGEVLLCLNTESALAEWARTHYPEYSTAKVEEQLRWNAGDWEYQGFNTDEPYSNEWEKSWSETKDRIAVAALEDDDVCEEFLESVCRVLIRLERSPAFLRIQREAHFKTLVSDHDEDLEDSRERLARIRAMEQEPG